MDMTLMSTPLCNDSHKKGKKNMGEMTGNSSTGVNPKKRLWTEAEDCILVAYVYTYGDRKWSNVHRVTGLSRTGKSCRLRWRDQLRPGLKKEQFSPEEELLIGELHHRLGNQWAVIAQYLPGRTDNSVKNFWYNRCKKRTRGTMKNVLKVDEQDQSNLPQSPPPTENDSEGKQELPEWTPANLCEICKADRLLLNLSKEGSELSSIQDEETHQEFEGEGGLPYLPLESFDSSDGGIIQSLLPETSGLNLMQQKDLVNAEEFALYTFPECYDELDDLMLTEGDIVDYWLNLPSSDGSLSQEHICQESMCSNNGAIGNTSVAEDEIDLLPDLLDSPGFALFLDQEPICEDAICAKTGTTDTLIDATECNDSIVGTLAEDEIDELIDSLHSPGFNVFLDQDFICDDAMSANNGTVDNVAAILDDYLSEEPISEAADCANDGTISDDVAVVEGINWYDSYIVDEFFNLEEICQDGNLSANDGTFDNLGATTTSCVPNDEWDQTFIFWRTPFFSQTD